MPFPNLFTNFLILFFANIRSASAFAPLVTTSSAWPLVPVHASSHQSWHNPSATTATAV